MIDLLVGCVLLDHIYDWTQDLEAGRYNAFVAYCSDLPQRKDNDEANRTAVAIELYLGDGARPYLGLVHQYLGKARARASLVGCEGLAEFITVLDDDIADYGSRLMADINRVIPRRFAVTMPVDRILIED